jgi:hypothetical protein
MARTMFLVPSQGALVPLKVRITFTPTSATLEREYDPAVSFSNGATALYSDQFDVIPVDDVSTVVQQEAGQSVQDLGGIHTAVRFHDSGGPVFVQGRRQRNPMLTGERPTSFLVQARSKIGAASRCCPTRLYRNG